MREAAAILSAIIITLGCGEAHSEEGQSVTDTPPEWSSACEAPGPVAYLHGLEADAIVARLRPPQSTEGFRAGERQDELHVSIQNTYPLPESADVLLEEWRWSKNGCNLVLWLHNPTEPWAAFASLRWPDGTEL